MASGGTVQNLRETETAWQQESLCLMDEVQVRRIKKKRKN
jgi:hypothetical protein